MSSGPELKAGVSHNDVIDTAPSSMSGGHNALHGDADIIHALENTGEEVGMTTRSILAAMVSTYNCATHFRYQG
jgi:pyruvate/oxaloacetate carboxyltransferase